MRGWTFLKTGASSLDDWGDKLSAEIPDDPFFDAVKGTEPFGVISAYGRGARAEDGSNHERLKVDLTQLGFDFYEGVGVWEGVVEQSLIVPGIPLAILSDLAEKYHQESVIYRGDDKLLVLYHLLEKTAAPAIGADGKLYLKGDRLLWGPAHPWDGHIPLLQEDVDENGDFVRTR